MIRLLGGYELLIFRRVSKQFSVVSRDSASWFMLDLCKYWILHALVEFGTGDKTSGLPSDLGEQECEYNAVSTKYALHDITVVLIYWCIVVRVGRMLSVRGEARALFRLAGRKCVGPKSACVGGPP